MEAKMGRQMHQVNYSSRSVYEMLTTTAESTTPQTIILTSLLDVLGDGFKMKARVTPLTIKAILEVSLQTLSQQSMKPDRAITRPSTPAKSKDSFPRPWACTQYALAWSNPA